jgi:DNA polymerase-3 subunit gamma/tau
MSQALYRKWRPQTFDQIVGQEHVTQTLRNALASGWVRHAYLFAGLRGTGKTTMARLVAKAVNCLDEDPACRPCNTCSICQAINEGRFLDLIEIDAASHTSVDDVRELRDKIGFRPNEGRYKVYIIDEVHRFSGSAFDALLKTIEEPPEHALFILATTEIHKVPATILSRCQRFDFRRIPVQQITQRLKTLAEAEKIAADVEALMLIARSATGSLRDAESLLDQLAAANVDGITVERVQQTLGTIDVELVTNLVHSLVERDVARGLALIDRALDQGADLRQFARQIVDHLRSLLLIQLHGAGLIDASAEAIEALEAQSERLSTRVLVQAIKRFSEAEAELRGGWQPQLPLELALVETILGSAIDSPQASSAVSQPGPVREVVSSYLGDPDPPPTRPEPTPVPAKEPEPESPRPVESISPGSLSLAVVQQNWSQVLDLVRSRDKSVQALLNSTRPADVQDEVITLHVAHEFARSKLSEGRARQLVEEVMNQIFRQECQVNFKVAALDGDESTMSADGVLEPAASNTVATSNVAQNQPRNALESDPLVEAAKQMGAEVRLIPEGSEK